MSFLKKYKYKWSLVFFLTLLLIFAGVAHWLQSARFKTMLEKEWQAFDLHAAETGKIHWQFFPQPGLWLKDLSLQNVQNSFQLHFKRVFFQLKWSALLKGKIVFSDLKVKGFQIKSNSMEGKGLEEASQFFSKLPLMLSLQEEHFSLEHFFFTEGTCNFETKDKMLSLRHLQIAGEPFYLTENNELKDNKSKENILPLQFKGLLSANNRDNSVLFKGEMNFKGNFVYPMPEAQSKAFPWLEGQLNLQKIKLNDLKVDRINGNLKLKASELTLNPLTITAYEGAAVGDLSYIFKDQVLDIHQSGTNFNAYSMLADMFNKQWVKGSLDFSLHAQTQLSKLGLPSGWLGKGSITIKEGQLLSLDLNELLRPKISEAETSFAEAKKESFFSHFYKIFASNRNFSKTYTPFELLTLQYQLKPGLLKSPSLIFQSDIFQIKGDAVLDLSSHALNSHLLLTLNKAESLMPFYHSLKNEIALEIKGYLEEPLFYQEGEKLPLQGALLRSAFAGIAFKMDKKPLLPFSPLMKSSTEQG